MKTLIFAFVTVGVLSIFCFAQEQMPVPTNNEQSLGKQLADNDESVRQTAINSIRKLAAERPEAIAAPLRRTWLKPMSKAGLNDDIVKMTQTAILLSPGSQLVLESMLRARVYALVALGRTDEALGDARRFYNVCALDQSGLAVDLLVTAMEARFGTKGEAKIRQFRMWQVTAAAATEEPTDAQPTTAPSTESVQADFVLGSDAVNQMILSIPIDGSLYMTEAAKWKTNRRQPLAYGNLLLLAGHSDEAYAYYTDLLNGERTEKSLAVALERQSAAMRAQDGNLARAQGRLRRLQSDAQ